METEHFYDDFYEYVFVFGVEDEINISLSSFPNPSNGQFTVVVDQTMASLEFELFNLNGQSVSI